MEEEKSAFGSFELSLPLPILTLFKEISTWTYFLSIIGFVGIGLLLVVGLIISFAMGGMNPYAELGMDMAYFGLVYIVLAVVYFFPVLYLFNFSRKVKSAINSKNNDTLIDAFSNLKSHYKFVGILSIAIIGLYVLIFVIAVIAGMMY